MKNTFEPSKTALLVIDVQKLITTPELYMHGQFISNVKALIACARTNGIEVIFVRHDDGPGKPLSRGADGYDIIDELSPFVSEPVFDKTVNSPFRDCGLLEHLESAGKDTVIISGLQTDYCIDAAVKCGFEHHLRVIVPSCANTTVANDFMTAEETYNYYNNFIWPGRYAECRDIADVLKMMTER